MELKDWFCTILNPRILLPMFAFACVVEFVVITSIQKAKVVNFCTCIADVNEVF
jgi:hypothetical protein